MSRKGHCWDSAVAESFFSSLKKERIKKQIDKNRALATADVAAYIEAFYNRTAGARSRPSNWSSQDSVETLPTRLVSRLVATGFFSSGGGRYIANTNLPDFIVNPDASITLVATRSYLIGTEIQAARKRGLYAYDSEAHADRAVTSDVDGSAIGFGVAGSTAANERIGEATAGVTQTLFRDPKIGGMQFMVQYSHVRRTPFSVPAGTPADAAVNMLSMNVRYFLP
jgi:hypothetical protein